MSWKWKGKLPIEPGAPSSLEAFARMSAEHEEWPSILEVQVTDGRAYVLAEAAGTLFFWFVMDLAGLYTPGAGDGNDWVQVSLGGNVTPKTRNTEHLRKNTKYLHPGYVSEKFPGYGAVDYEAIAYFFIPFLTNVLTMDPLEGAE